jgi:hypothetical protein
MVKVEIVEPLYNEILKKFKKESVTVLQHLKSLEESPKSGKLLGAVGNVLIKELKHKGFRFYFLVDGFRLKLMSKDGLVDLLMRFVRMSDKKYQQEAIEHIKTVLRKIGPGGFA